MIEEKYLERHKKAGDNLYYIYYRKVLISAFSNTENFLLEFSDTTSNNWRKVKQRGGNVSYRLWYTLSWHFKVNPLVNAE